MSIATKKKLVADLQAQVDALEKVKHKGKGRVLERFLSWA